MFVPPILAANFLAASIANYLVVLSYSNILVSPWVVHLCSFPKPSIPNLLPDGRLYKNRTIASLVIFILLFNVIEPDLSMRKMKLYLFSKASSISCSSRSPTCVWIVSDFYASGVKVGRSETMTATWSGYLSDVW